MSHCELDDFKLLRISGIRRVCKSDFFFYPSGAEKVSNNPCTTRVIIRPTFLSLIFTNFISAICMDELMNIKQNALNTACEQTRVPMSRYSIFVHCQF